MWKMALRHVEVEPMDVDWMAIRSSKHQVLIYARRTPPTHLVDGSGVWGRRWSTRKVHRWCKGRINEGIDQRTLEMNYTCSRASNNDKVDTLIRIWIWMFTNLLTWKSKVQSWLRLTKHVDEHLDKSAYSGTKNNAIKSRHKARR